jgi:hypothetical protein
VKQEHSKQPDIQKMTPADRDLYDGKTQDVSAEPQGDGSGRGSRRAGDEPQRHAQRGQAGPADDDLLL